MHTYYLWTYLLALWCKLSHAGFKLNDDDVAIVKMLGHKCHDNGFQTKNTISFNELISHNPSNKKIAVFIHAGYPEHAFESTLTASTRIAVLMELLAALKKGHLLDVSNVYMTFIGPQFEQCLSHELLAHYAPFSYIFETVEGVECEFATLTAIQQYVTNIPDDHLVLYLHTKGATRYDDLFVESWRHYMTYFLIERFDVCVEALIQHGFQTCGVSKQVRIILSAIFNVYL
jgi:lipopolysaccharide biosynthesis protein